MVKTTVQQVGPSGQSSRAATLRVAHCSTGMSITISDSSSDDNSVDKSKQKLKMVAKHCAGGRYSGKVLDTTMSKLLSIFPNVCPTAAASHLSKHLQRTSPETALQRTVHHFLVKGVPASTVEVTPESLQSLKKPEVDLGDNREPIQYLDGEQQNFEDFVPPEVVPSGVVPPEVVPPGVVAPEVVPPEVEIEYYAWSLYTLMREFPRVPITALKQVLKTNDRRFAPSYKAIRAVIAADERTQGRNKGYLVHTNGNGGHTALRFRLNKHPRAVAPSKPVITCPFFEKEMATLEIALGDVEEQVKVVCLEQPVSDAGKGMGLVVTEGINSDIECGCCCSDYPFEEMAQCAEGHLFCFGCLRRRVEESTFGGSQACGSLPCMDTGGCVESFPWSEVKRALPADVFSKYEQRQAEDAVVQAKLTGLVYCPFCNMPWQVDPDLCVLKCANGSCLKASCLLCKEPNHVPLKCEDVERKSEVSMRRIIEERMTKALIRICNVCKAELVKSDGCNKVKCRCGQTMCYVCRKSIKPNYEHFCQHVQTPGRSCATCKKCNLWEKEEEDEVAAAAREAAMKELAMNEPNLLKRAIGPKLDNPDKKRHHTRPPPVPAVPFRPPPPEYYREFAQAMANVALQGAFDEF